MATRRGQGMETSRVALALFTVWSAATTLAGAEAKLALSHDHWDFGQATRGEKLTATLQARNEGDAPLQVYSVLSSCGACLGARISPERIVPGAKGLLEIWCHTGPWGEGKQQRELTIRSNDFKVPERKLSVTVEVLRAPHPKIRIEPDTWALGLIPPDEVRRMDLVVHNLGDRALHIKGLAPSGRVQALPPERSSLDPGQVTHISLQFTADGLEGPVAEAVEVLTNDPKTPVTRVPVTGYAHPAATALAKGVILEPIFGGAQPSMTGLRVTNRLTIPLSALLEPAPGKPVAEPLAPHGWVLLKAGERGDVIVAGQAVGSTHAGPSMLKLAIPAPAPPDHTAPAR